VFTSLRDYLCGKSLRWLWMLVYSFASFCLAFFQLWEPFSLRERTRWACFRRFSVLLRYLGFSMILPSERAANFSRPALRPMTDPLLVCDWVSFISTAEIAHHLPAASCLMIRVLTIPDISRYSFTFIRPIFNSFSLPSYKEAPFPFRNWVNVIDLCRLLPLEKGISRRFSVPDPAEEGSKGPFYPKQYFLGYLCRFL